MSEERNTTAVKEPQNQPSPERAHETRRAIIIAALVIVGVFVGLLLFISPETDKQKQGVALVLAIGTGGIAAFVGLYLTGQQLRTTRELEEDRAREAALRACLEQLGRLLTDTKWNPTKQASNSDNQASNTLRNLARAEALSVLGSLDGLRKRILVRFLYESGVLNKDNPTVVLSGADLRWAELKGSQLPNAALSGVRLGGANLSNADLSDANLSNADLSEANLKDANLRNANLNDANLSGATVSEEQLQAAKSLEGATMPDGSKHP